MRSSARVVGLQTAAVVDKIARHAALYMAAARLQLATNIDGSVHARYASVEGVIR